jgi:hypothetical protein
MMGYESICASDEYQFQGHIPYERKRIHLSFPPVGGRAAGAFQSLFSHIDGKIRDGYGVDGCGRKVVGTAEVATDPAIALSVI